MTLPWQYGNMEPHDLLILFFQWEELMPGCPEFILGVATPKRLRKVSKRALSMVCITSHPFSESLSGGHPTTTFESLDLDRLNGLG